MGQSSKVQLLVRGQKCTLGPTFLQARGKQGTGTAEADCARFDRGGSRTVARR